MLTNGLFGWEAAHEYSEENVYDERGNLINKKHKSGGVVTKSNTYTYDNGNRLKTENTGFGSREYFYNTDGSIDKVKAAGGEDKYSYDKGRLKSIIPASGAAKHYGYDSYGNCTHYALSSSADANNSSKANLEWHRGNLLRKYGNTTYTYNRSRTAAVAGDRLEHYMAGCLQSLKFFH